MSLSIPDSGPATDRISELIDQSTFRFEAKLAQLGVPTLLARTMGWIEDYRKELKAIAEAVKHERS